MVQYKVNINDLTGWLSPDGVLHGCNTWGHSTLAKTLCSRQNINCFNSEQELEKRGWIRLSCGLPLKDRTTPTDSQKKFVTDYFLVSKKEFPDHVHPVFKDYLN